MLKTFWFPFGGEDYLISTRLGAGVTLDPSSPLMKYDGEGMEEGGWGIRGSGGRRKPLWAPEKTEGMPP